MVDGSCELRNVFSSSGGIVIDVVGQICSVYRHDGGVATGFLELGCRQDSPFS